MNRLLIKACIVLLITISNIQGAISENLVQLGQITRGYVDDFSVVTLKTDFAGGVHYLGNQFVVAMRDSEDKLRLMVIEVSDTGHPNVIANTVTEGTIKDVSVCRVSRKRIVTAVRDSKDKLRLIAFDITNNGRKIERLGTKISRSIREVDIAGEGDASSKPTDHRRVFTVASDSDGKLFVADWKVKRNGNIKQLDSKTYASASMLDVENGDTGSYFMSVAMRDSEDLLRLIAFQSPNQTSIKRGGFSTGGKIREVSSTGYNFASNIYTVSISEGPVGVHGGLTPIDRYIVDAGFLKIIRWAHKSNDDLLSLISISSEDFERKLEREITGPSRTEAKYEGMAETADIMNLNFTRFRTEIITAHAGFGTFKKLRTRDQGKRRLRIIAWDKNLSAASKIHLGGHYTKVELAPLNFVNDIGRFVTVLRGIRGELKVVVWGLK